LKDLLLRLRAGAKRGGSKYRVGTLKPLLTRLKLDIKRAIEAQRIGCLPKIELARKKEGSGRPFF